MPEKARLLGIHRVTGILLRDGRRLPSAGLLARCARAIPDFDAAGTIREFEDADHRRTPAAPAPEPAP
jgi:hypothetical protein